MPAASIACPAAIADFPADFARKDFNRESYAFTLHSAENANMGS
jgi:hypothetical protein